MTPRTRATLLLTAAATGVFFGLRALPDSACGFLHLHDNVVSAEGLEYCAPNEVALFADPTAMKFPVTAEIEPDSPLVSGKTTHLRLRLRAPNGNLMSPGEIAYSHTKRVHLMVADPALDAYRHIHPEPEGDGRDWGFDFTPVAGGEHVFFVDCVHTFTKRPQIIRLSLPVEGSPVPAGPLHGLSAVSEDGVSLALSLDPETPKAGDDISIRLRFTGAKGAPVALKPIMAAYTHMVAFNPERTGFAHLHPLESAHEKDASPELLFRFRTDTPGRYRLWAQFDTGHGERYVPFDIFVR